MPEVIVYTSFFCGYCHRAKALLNKKSIPYKEIDVTMDPKLRDEMTAKAGGRRSVPQIFIGERHIGGSDELAQLARSGELDKLLAGP